MKNIFEKATEEKIRFEYKGTISTEELWDLDVNELDGIFKVLNGSKKQLSEESLLGTQTTQDTLVNTQIKIIKHIVESKIAAKEARLLLAERKDKKEKIMSILASKEDNALEQKSTIQLRKMLNEL